jgi:hypothetical protein
VQKNTKSLEREFQRKPLNCSTSDITIKNLQEQGRCSLHAKKEYIAERYKLDCETLSSFIKMYIVFSITFSKLAKTKERGASVSFMLAAKKGLRSLLCLLHKFEGGLVLCLNQMRRRNMHLSLRSIPQKSCCECSRKEESSLIS